MLSGAIGDISDDSKVCSFAATGIPSRHLPCVGYVPSGHQFEALKQLLGPAIDA